MKGTGSIMVFLLFALILDLDFARACGSIQEGSISNVRCRIPATADFQTFGTQVRSMSGEVRFLSVCFRNTSCTDNEPSSYQAELSLINNTRTGQDDYVLVMKVGSVNRNDAEIQCVVDAIVSARCVLDVYVVPEEPVCEPPMFVEDGNTIYLKCTADKVYPGAVFNFTVQPEIEDSNQQVSYQPSARYPGNQVATCELRVPVRGHPAGDYNFRPSVRADVPPSPIGPIESVLGDTVEVKLREVVLESHFGNETFEVEDGGDLSRTIRIRGNPPPNRFSLTMRASVRSSPLNVPDNAYVLTYTSGSLLLKLKDIGGSGPGFGRYTLRAGNRVGGDWPQMEYTFTIHNKEGSSSSSNVPIIIGVAVGCAVLVIAVVVVICIVKRNRSRKSSAGRNIGNFDAPYGLEGAPYIYPNFGFQPNDEGYNKTTQPPPYTPETHTYASPNDYMEIGPTLTQPSEEM